MGSDETTLNPVAVALHTRDREDDYRWVFEDRDGPVHLIARLKDLHRGLIADQDANPAATFVLLDEGAEIGLLAAKLKSPRLDHSRTSIEDTLLLEFESPDRSAVLRLTAELLGPNAAVIQRRLLDYAEGYFQQTAMRSIEPITVTLPSPCGGDADDLRNRRVGLRSTEQNRQRVAGLLHRAAGDPNLIQRPFILVSTGFVGKDRLQTVSPEVGWFIALSRSKSIPEVGEVALDPMSEKKKLAEIPRMAVRVFVLSCVLVLIFLGSWKLFGTTDQNLPLRDEVAGLRTEVGRLRGEVGGLGKEVERLRSELVRLRGEAARQPLPK